MGGWDWSFTTAQRSLINSILRKNLGDSKVAKRIWTVGLPKIVGESVQDATDVGLLKSCMHDCLRWFVNLAKDLVDHTADQNYQNQRALSSLTPCAEQNRRREKLQEARQKFLEGKRLAAMRDSTKHTYDEMRPREQHVLEDYDTGKCQKQICANQVVGMRPFRSTNQEM